MRERARKQRSEEKRMRKRARAEARSERGVDPDLVDIELGPMAARPPDDDEVQQAIERAMNPGQIGGGERQRSPAKAAACRLFVGNLDTATTEPILRQHFKAAGQPPVDMTIVLDRQTGQSRGFAFVELSTPEAAQEAIENLDGTHCDGRPLRIRHADTRR